MYTLSLKFNSGNSNLHTVTCERKGLIIQKQVQLQYTLDIYVIHTYWVSAPMTMYIESVNASCVKMRE